MGNYFFNYSQEEPYDPELMLCINSFAITDRQFNYVVEQALNYDDEYLIYCNKPKFNH